VGPRGPSRAVVGSAIALIDTQPPVARVERIGDEYRIDGHDAVSHDDVTVRWRTAGGAWHESKGAAEVSLGDAAPESLEVQVVDEAGNVSPTRGSVAQPVEKFHGAPGSGGGCACGASGGGGTAGAAALIVGLALVGGRRRRRAWRVLRRALPSIAIVMIGGSLEGCSCSHNPCGSTACMPGEVMRGTIGRWNSMATDGTRTVATTYDQTLGDLVLVDLTQATPAYSVIDGIPDEPATYDPSTYRGGIPDAGPDVGAWSSVQLLGGKVRAAYQDRDRKALRFASENSAGGFSAHDVDVPMDAEEIGQYAKLAVDANGHPAIAYIATGVPGTGGLMTTELRLARAASSTPTQTSDWTITTIASGVRGCAGLCGADHCVKSATKGQPETCQAATTDCTPACGTGDVCVTTACLTEDTNQIVSLPGGVGMFANIMFLSDGRLAIVHYDLVRTALVAEIESGPGTSMFNETVLDGMDATDRGQWASAVADSGDTIHVAYQDALADELFYVEYKPGGSPTTPELVDDGTRPGDRTHNVGAGARLWLDGGSTPRIAYQDGLSSDMYLASRGTGGTWTTNDAVTGVRLDGFHIAAPPNGGWLVWDGIDQTAAPASTLQVKQNP
jgi:MYXO-CTERM domain-containing protein